MIKKALFVCLHRPGRSPSQRFRFEQYLDYLSENDFECSHVFLLNAKQDKRYYASGNYVHKAFILLASIGILLKHAFFKKYDIVYVQREAFMLGTAYFERRFAKRSKLIFDFDDSIFRQQTGKIKSKNRWLYFLKNPDKTADIIKVADMVFAGNNYLANYARQINENVKIIPTTINTKEYPLIEKKLKDPVCIGWSGSFSTIIHFQYVIEVLLRIREKYGSQVYFKVIGDGSYQHETLDIQGLPWKRETEVQDLSEIDIGVMPLPDDEWTKGKCGLKGLQYMALGIPVIMSPIGVNNEIIDDGVNGYLAGNDDQWVEKLSRLVESPEMRKTMGLAGRQTVVERYSVEANKDLYLRYFNEVLA